jgi:hypothetical protein
LAKLWRKWQRKVDRGVDRRPPLFNIFITQCNGLIGNYAGIVIPYVLPGEGDVREYRLRRDQPDFEYDSSGNLKVKQKYLSPPGRSNMLYLLPRVDRSLLANNALPIVITEGEFKTLALWRAAQHETQDRPRFLPVTPTHMNRTPVIHIWKLKAIEAFRFTRKGTPLL